MNPKENLCPLKNSLWFSFQSYHEQLGKVPWFSFERASTMGEPNTTEIVVHILWFPHLQRQIPLHYIAHKGVPVPLFKAPTPWLSLPPFLKFLFSLPTFLFHPLLRYFRQFPHPHAIPSCHNLTNQFSLV